MKQFGKWLLKTRLSSFIFAVSADACQVSKRFFLDEGDIDMHRAMSIYRDAGFNGPFMMDHTPGFPQTDAGRAGQAYAVGYIRGVIQSVYR